jgi:biopolymer transport protein ExbD
MAKRKRAEGESRGVEVSRVVTPMLDMVFQLLFFFIVAYDPGRVEGQLDLALPLDKAQQTAAKDPKDIDPSKPADPLDLELASDVTVVVRTQRAGDSDGRISELKIQDKANPAGMSIPNILNARQESVPDYASLEDKLKEVRAGLSNKEGLTIQADSRLHWAYVVRVMDVCRRAGFQDIGFAPPPVESGG